MHLHIYATSFFFSFSLSSNMHASSAFQYLSMSRFVIDLINVCVQILDQEPTAFQGQSTACSDKHVHSINFFLVIRKKKKRERERTILLTCMPMTQPALSPQAVIRSTSRTASRKLSQMCNSVVPVKDGLYLVQCCSQMCIVLFLDPHLGLPILVLLFCIYVTLRTTKHW